jgi:hypothetical protein
MILGTNPFQHLDLGGGSQWRGFSLALADVGQKRELRSGGTAGLARMIAFGLENIVVFIFCLQY